MPYYDLPQHITSMSNKIVSFTKGKSIYYFFIADSSSLYILYIFNSIKREKIKVDSFSLLSESAISLLRKGYKIDVYKSRYGAILKKNITEKYIKLLKLYYDGNFKLNEEFINFMIFYLTDDVHQVQVSMENINHILKERLKNAIQ